MDILKRLGIDFHVTQLLSIYPKGPKTLQERQSQPSVHRSIIYMSGTLETTQVSESAGMVKETTVCVHSGILLLFKKR